MCLLICSEIVMLEICVYRYQSSFWIIDFLMAEEYRLFIFLKNNLLILVVLVFIALQRAFLQLQPARANSSWRCGGSSVRSTFFCGAQSLGMQASVVGARGLQRGLNSCAAWALLCRMWDLPRPGNEPMSPALVGRFFTKGDVGMRTQTGIARNTEEIPLSNKPSGVISKCQTHLQIGNLFFSGICSKSACLSAQPDFQNRCALLLKGFSLQAMATGQLYT